MEYEIGTLLSTYEGNLGIIVGYHKNGYEIYWPYLNNKYGTYSNDVIRVYLLNFRKTVLYAGVTQG